MCPSIKVPFFSHAIWGGLWWMVTVFPWNAGRVVHCSHARCEVFRFTFRFDRLFWKLHLPKQTRLKLKHPIFFREDVDNILTPKDDLAIRSSLKRPCSEFQEFGGWNLAKYKWMTWMEKDQNEAFGLKGETQHWTSSSWWRLFGDVSMTRVFIISVVKMM